MTDSAFNWIVPLRRVVITQDVLYRELMWEWLRLLAPTRISRDQTPVVGGEDPNDGKGKKNAAQHYDDVEINSWVLAAWYTDPNDSDFSPNHYAKGVAELRHWWHDCFNGVVPTSNSGTTTKDIPEFNFHARLWKGPKRVLAELNAKSDEGKLDALRPYTWDGGKLGLKPDSNHRAQKIPLLPGDVLELPLHVFLFACGQKRFLGVDFNPKGSFFLGTSVHKPGGGDVPQLHDNLLAMRYQLIHSLALANCYHHEPVFDSSFRPSASLVKPEGAGVFARGMPYGGNLGAEPEEDRWEITNVNALQVDKDLPIYLPNYDSFRRLADGLPLTWGWVCSPFALLWLHYMAVSHRTVSGILFGPKTQVRGSSMGSAVMTAMDNKNKSRLEVVHGFQNKHGGDPLLLHNLTEDDITLPREQPPVADLCEFVFPDGGPMPSDRKFSQPDFLHTIPEPPAKGHDVAISNLCPDAGILMVSSAAGHEFAVVRLNYPDRLRERAIDALVADKPFDQIQMPIAGELSAYCPLSGVDRFTQAKAVAEAEEAAKKKKEKNKKTEEEKEQDDTDDKPNRDAGQYFVDESSALLLPRGKKRGLYKPLQLQEFDLHVFKPVKDNMLFFLRDKEGLKVAEGGRSSLRGKAVSTIIFIRHGGVRDPNPRTLTNIYESVSDWHPLTLKLPHAGPKEIKELLANWASLYAERAVPFPALQEVAAAFPSKTRILAQLINHRDRIKEIQKNSAHYKAEHDGLVAKIKALEQQHSQEKEKSKQRDLEEQIDEASAKLAKIEPEYNISQNPDLAKDLLAELPPDHIVKPTP